MARFSEILTIINGRNQKQVENPNGKYPIYGSGGIMGYADDFICDGGTVIIGRKGSINKPIFVDRPFWNVDTAFGLSAKRNILLPKYLYYFCEVFDFEKLNTTVTIPSLTKANLLDIEIKLPSLTEQEHVVTLLDRVSDLISLRKQQLAKLDELVKVRFVEMFGTLATTNYSVKTLDDLCVFIKDGTHQTPRYTEDARNGIKFLSSKDVTSGQIDWTKIKYIPQDLHKELYARIAPQKGDILLAKNGTTGIPAIVDTDDIFDIYVSLALLRFRPGNHVIYLWAALSALETKRQFDSSLKGIGVPNLHLSEIKKTKIIVPPIELQNKFADFVEKINRQKLTIQQSLDKLEVLKKSLMQEYFG